LRSSPESCDGIGDDELIGAFGEGRVTKEMFRHRDHVRLAYLYLTKYEDLAEAALHFRRAFRRFTVEQGVPHLYNETLTWAYLVLIQRRMFERLVGSSFELLEHSPDLAEHRTGLISRYYDLDGVMQSPLAKALFLLPEPRSST
jgi:hypothetical protein